MRRVGDEALLLEDDYWDAIVRGQPPRSDLAPELVEGIARTHALDDATGPDSSFVERLKEELTRQNAALGSSPDHGPTNASPALNGRTHLKPETYRYETTSKKHGHGLRTQTVFVQFAALFLLLSLLAGSGLAIRFGILELRDDELSSIPAPQVSPEASPARSFEFVWETRGDPADPMASSPFIAVAPDGTIWVTDEKSGTIRIFSPDGELLDVWGKTGTGEGEFAFGPGSSTGWTLGSIAFDQAGNIYVLDAGNYRVQKFGPDRVFLTAWGSKGNGDGQFVSPTDIAVDAQGRIVVVDDRRSKPETTVQPTTLVQVFDSDGGFLFDWGMMSIGPEPGKLMRPLAIGIDPGGPILVTEAGAQTIRRFTPEGQDLGTISGFGSEDGQVLQLKDVAVDGQGRIYVADWAKHLITVLDRDGRFLASWGDYGTGPGQFHFPYGLALDGEGNLYVTDDNGRLQKFRLPPLPELAGTPVA